MAAVEGGDDMEAGEASLIKPIETFPFYEKSERITTAGLIFKLLIQEGGKVLQDAAPFDFNIADTSFQNIKSGASVSSAVYAMATDMYNEIDQPKVNVIYINNMSNFSKLSLLKEESTVCVIYKKTANVFFVPENATLEKDTDNQYNIWTALNDGEREPLGALSTWVLTTDAKKIEITKSIPNAERTWIYKNYRDERRVSVDRKRETDRKSQNTIGKRQVSVKINEKMSIVVDEVLARVKQLPNDDVKDKVIKVWKTFNENLLGFEKLKCREDNTKWIQNMFLTWIRLISFWGVMYPAADRNSVYGLIQTVITTVLDILKPVNKQQIGNYIKATFISLYKTDDHEKCKAFYKKAFEIDIE